MPGTSALGKRTPSTRPDDARYAVKARLHAGILAGQFAPATTSAFPAVASTQPTISTSTTGVLTRGVGPTDPSIRVTRGMMYWDTPNNRYGLGWPATYEFMLLGAGFEIVWYAAGATGTDSFWFWVDGQPLSALPASTGATTSLGSKQLTAVAFADSTPRRITIYIDGVNSISNLQIAPTTALSAVPSPLRGLFVGDSFFQGANGIPSWGFSAAAMSRLLGVDCGNIGEGGVGYVNAGVGRHGVYSNSTKVAVAQAYAPDFIVFSGSVNDDGKAGIQAAATATYNAYAAACPGAPMIVFGAQPSNATDTVATARQANNAAIRAAAIAHPSVIAFHDMIGHAAGTIAAWSSGSTYQPGDLVTNGGSIYQWGVPISGNSSSPGTSARWSLVTYLYSGTGRTGATTGDGSRDNYLAADAVHPTQVGSNALALRQAAAIRGDLVAYAAS